MPTTVKAAARAIAVAAAIFLGLLRVASAGVARKEVDYDALERAWEAGDAAQELLSEGDEQFRHLSETYESHWSEQQSDSSLRQGTNARV